MSGARERPPGGFLWGVATSGYQCEGGFNGPGQPHNNWADAEASGRVARSGAACDFWNRYGEDFALCQDMGLNAFRLSIEWARIQPCFSSEKQRPPPFDENALDAYAERLAAARAHGLEPVVTLHHFTHPAWLGPEAWLQDDTPALFEAFARHAIRHLNAALIRRHHQAPLRWIVTINEPNMLVINTWLTGHFPGGESQRGMAVGVRAYNRLLAAHVRTYNALHDDYAQAGFPPPRVALNTFCSDVYWSENMLLDLLFSRVRGIERRHLADALREGSEQLRRALHGAGLPFRDDPFVWLGRGVHWLVDILAPRHATAETFSFFLDELERSPRARVMDFLGLDYYDPFTGHLFRAPRFHDIEFPSLNITGHLMAGLSRKWWDWHVLPEGLHFFASYYSQRFAEMGILIAENGMAVRCGPDGVSCQPRADCVTRSAFLEAHLAQIRRLLAEKTPMLGYLHWSLTDNYEWGSFAPRFGLFAVDYTDEMRRLAEGHQGDYPSRTYARLIRDMTAP